MKKERIRSRPGWEQITAVRNNHIYEVKSTYILQPGPAALTEGVRQLHAILAAVAGQAVDPVLAPEEKIDPALARRRAESEAYRFLADPDVPNAVKRRPTIAEDPSA